MSYTDFTQKNNYTVFITVSVSDQLWKKCRWFGNTIGWCTSKIFKSVCKDEHFYVADSKKVKQKS